MLLSVGLLLLRALLGPAAAPLGMASATQSAAAPLGGVAAAPLGGTATALFAAAPLGWVAAAPIGGHAVDLGTAAPLGGAAFAHGAAAQGSMVARTSPPISSSQGSPAFPSPSSILIKI